MEQETLIQRYKDYVLGQAKRPASVYRFMQEMEKDEKAFYAHFASFEALEQQLFYSYFENTISRLSASEEYQEYDSLQKILAFFYTWLEVMQADRSLVLFMQQHAHYPLFSLTPSYMASTQEPFEEHMRKLLKVAIDDGQVADRMFVTRYYKQGFWAQARQILRYWLNDHSQDFEKTDAMVEKSLRLAFDIIEPNTLDSGFDLVRFLWRG
ncbi:MAG: TetR family transcriptional regulator C-terminal domain-containing protein [Bacteroidota bacterium]